MPYMARGSFLRGNATEFSDVDISVYCAPEKLSDFIYGYGKPIFISFGIFSCD